MHAWIDEISLQWDVWRSSAGAGSWKTDHVEPFPRSICHGCAHLRVVTSAKGSTFLMCREPSLPKYPAQPVLQCPRRAPLA